MFVLQDLLTVLLETSGFSKQFKARKFVKFAAMFHELRQLRVAILDLYEGQPNEGMRCIREILNQFSEINHIDLVLDEFEVRLSQQIPDFTYDIYISSGGPGSPLESEHSDWEKKYFDFLQRVTDYNEAASNPVKKHVFFICHSFQLACRFFNVAEVTKRKSSAFGVFPIHLLKGGKSEKVFQGLNDPFYSVDSRDYQVLHPKQQALRKMGGAVLAIEKERPHVPLDRAIMAIRFNKYMIGTQCHPEADPVGMTMYLEREDKKQMVIENYGLEKWRSMIDHLNDPDKILWTYSHILPNFLSISVKHLQSVEV
ncbi:MAG TPA: GMP synthase [Chitinophagaceae bacterium]|nr:GMP synthase [Chitinophagaceae bacterium]